MGIRQSKHERQFQAELLPGIRWCPKCGLLGKLFWRFKREPSPMCVKIPNFEIVNNLGDVRLLPCAEFAVGRPQLF